MSCGRERSWGKESDGEHVAKKSEFARVAIWVAGADRKCVGIDRLEQEIKRGVCMC